MSFSFSFISPSPFFGYLPIFIPLSEAFKFNCPDSILSTKLVADSVNISCILLPSLALVSKKSNWLSSANFCPSSKETALLPSKSLLFPTKTIIFKTHIFTFLKPFYYIIKYFSTFNIIYDKITCRIFIIRSSYRTKCFFQLCPIFEFLYFSLL